MTPADDYTEASRAQRAADAARSGELARHEADAAAWGEECARDAGRCEAGCCVGRCECGEGRQ